MNRKILGTQESKGIFRKELDSIAKKENKMLNTMTKESKIKNSLYEKVPLALCTTLEGAFEKAFMLVFLKGTGIIEKTFDKEAILLEYEARNYVVDKVGSRKSIKKVERAASKNGLFNHTATTTAGFGLGLVGMGLPDIPLLVSTLLKGVYEIALGYGISYESTEEKIYILRIICIALSEGDIRKAYNQMLENMADSRINQEEFNGYEEQKKEDKKKDKKKLDVEIKAAAKVLSDALLVEKFVQGIPIIGVVGGFVNHAVYQKVSAVATIKYKKRYLLRKLED